MLVRKKFKKRYFYSPYVKYKANQNTSKGSVWDRPPNLSKRLDLGVCNREIELGKYKDDYIDYSYDDFADCHYEGLEYFFI